MPAPPLRTLKDRLRQVVLFEVGGLVVLTLPVVVVWTGMGWWAALVADIGLALAYAAYAFVFNLLYDRYFPIPASGRP